MEDVGSRFLDRSRSVTVWFPPSYSKDSMRHFPVLYMHDGQQLFDPSASTHGISWDIDGWVTRLAADKLIEEMIVVGIDCTEARQEEYGLPQLGQQYARFVIEELKPAIDAKHRTLPGRAHTAVAGASMGGLISFYLAWVYPHIFGAAACLSSAFSLHGNPYMLRSTKSSDITPDIRLYLYCGAGDDMEQRLMQDHVEMTEILAGKGLRPEKSLLIKDVADGKHDEETWCRQSEHWLPFLFPPGGPPHLETPF